MAEMSLITQANAQYAAAGAQRAKGALASAAQGKDMTRMREVAQDFEAVYLAQMMQPMLAEIGKDDPFSGPGQDMWRSMQAQEYGKAMAKSGGIGIADAVLKEMIKLQEVR